MRVNQLMAKGRTDQHTMVSDHARRSMQPRKQRAPLALEVKSRALHFMVANVQHGIVRVEKLGFQEGDRHGVQSGAALMSTVSSPWAFKASIVARKGPV